MQAIYEEHARFVWVTLQRLGVQAVDLEDLAHDVFVVVHQRLHTFDGSSRMTTWLFGICLRVAANYRRRQRRAPSEAAIRAQASDDATVQAGADEMLARRQDAASAERVLAELSLEKRAVFIMFEIEGVPCQDIAELMGVPVGTIYSRLHATRKQIAGDRFPNVRPRRGDQGAQVRCARVKALGRHDINATKTAHAGRL